GQEQGFFYAFAENPVTHAAWHFNYLTGSVVRINGIANIEYSTNLEGFKASTYGTQGPRKITDVDHDGLHDLNNLEYDAAPASIIIPRFMAAAGRANFDSELILIALSGGAVFTTM